MRKALTSFGVLCLGLALVATACSAQQDKSKRPSPPAKATFDLGGGKSITVEYSSPRAKGRKIFGDVVPYGKVWRTGANEATTFVTTADLTVGGTSVPAGTYSIFSVPNSEKWALIISKKVPGWGTDYPGEANDLARIDMKVSALSSPVENFTISFEKTATGANMNLEWERTRASVAIAKK
ncbi:MAG TPA: DUF2911 domain-containing protein [Candidatus Acidoferrum sp.]